MNQNDLPLEVVLQKIGVCPVCGKGQMVKGTAGWTCDYLHDLEDKCAFTIFEKYNGYTLTEADAVELITTGCTGERLFMTQGGKDYTAVMRLVDGQVKVVGQNASLPLPCPVCGGKVKEVQKGFVCENFFQDGQNHCNFWVSRQMCGREITLDDMDRLMEYGRTEVLDGFVSGGKAFSSCLVIDRQGNVKMDGTVCRCPKCGGTVYVGVKAYNCSNFRNPGIRCNFVVWRSLAGHTMTVNEVRQLCT